MNVKTNQQTRMERILQKKLTVFKNEKKKYISYNVFF